MRRRLLAFMLLAALCLPLLSRADPAIWTEAPPFLRPGRGARFSLVCDSPVNVTCIDSSGTQTIISGPLEPSAGVVSFPWDGTDADGPLPPGSYTLRAEGPGVLAETSVTLGVPAPVLFVSETPETLDPDWYAEISASMPGTVTVTLSGENIQTALVDQSVPAGASVIGAAPFRDYLKDLPAGDYDLYFSLTDASGCRSAEEILTVTVEEPAEPRPAHDAALHTPNEHSSVECPHDICYWKLPMGSMDEDAIWKVLTQPVTVLRGNQRKQVRVRLEPDKKCTDYTGVVTCDSQAVHILKPGDTWTLIEAYSSSQEGSSVKVWAERFEGYVETSLLQEKQVNQELGLVIDKLQQRLYVFKQGRLFATLLCSTGFPKKDTPFNETPAGEFLVVSRTGGFWSENLYCDMALRINDGILIHEVPWFLRTKKDGTTEKNYWNCELYLGEKASHGCIRVQRRPTPQGVSQKWLWDNVTTGTKVIIWDEIGRYLLPPDDDYLLYYNPDGGEQYHSDPECLAVLQKYRPLKPFRYGDLESAPYDRLTRCPACAPQLRLSEIDTVNRKNNRVVD